MNKKEKPKKKFIYIILTFLILITTLILNFFFQEEIKNYFNKNNLSIESDYANPNEIYSPKPWETVTLKNIIFNEEVSSPTASDYFLVDLSMTFTINNTLLNNSVKTVSLISCSFYFPNKDLTSDMGPNIHALEKIISKGGSRDTTFSVKTTTKLDCTYNEEGYRKCSNPKEITVSSCVFLYSSDESNRVADRINLRVGNLPENTEERVWISNKNDPSSSFDETIDVFEIVNIGQTINLE